MFINKLCLHMASLCTTHFTPQLSNRYLHFVLISTHYYTSLNCCCFMLWEWKMVNYGYCNIINLGSYPIQYTSMHVQYLVNNIFGLLFNGCTHTFHLIHKITHVVCVCVLEKLMHPVLFMPHLYTPTYAGIQKASFSTRCVRLLSELKCVEVALDLIFWKNIRMCRF